MFEQEDEWVSKTQMKKQMNDLQADFPHADAGKLRTLIRNTKKEQEQNKPPKNFRALFQEIKAVMEAGQSDASEEGQDWEE